MKKIFIGILFILASLYSFSQNGDIYKDFGEWSIDVKEHKLSISAFIVMDSIIETLSKHDIELEKRIVGKWGRDSIKEYNTIYRYRIFLKSNSVYDGDTTSTWVYGIKIFINGVEVTKDNHPNGFLVPIKSKPTLVYEYMTESLNQRPKFYIKWEKAIHGNKIKSK